MGTGEGGGYDGISVVLIWLIMCMKEVYGVRNNTYIGKKGFEI